jgi:hypothetical protein
MYTTNNSAHPKFRRVEFKIEKAPDQKSYNDSITMADFMLQPGA